MQKQRTALYIRVSTPEQAKEGYSVGEQQERLTALAKARGWQVIKVYADPGETGANMDRPGLQRMLSDIRAGLVDLVVVYKLDRLSRSQKDTLHLIEDVFLPNGVNFASLSEHLDTTTPTGRMMIGILSAFAQLEREQIQERTAMGKEARAKAGLWHGGGINRPTGYDYVDGRLVVNEYEAVAVRYVFNEVRRGIGIHTIYRQCEEKFPGVFKFESTVRLLVRNPLYIGYLQYKGETYPGQHPPLIDEELFGVVQEITRKKAAKSPENRHPYLLTGLLHCGRCGARMHGRSGTKLKDGYIRYYVCYSRSGQQRHMMTCEHCDMPLIRTDQLDPFVIDSVKQLRIEDVEAAGDEQTDENARRVALMRKEVERLDGKISKLIDLYADDAMPLDMMKAKMDEMTEQKRALEKEIQALEVAKGGKTHEEVAGLIQTLQEFDWETAEPEQKRVILSQFIERIEAFGNREDDPVRIVWAL